MQAKGDPPFVKKLTLQLRRLKRVGTVQKTWDEPMIHIPIMFNNFIYYINLYRQSVLNLCNVELKSVRFLHKLLANISFENLTLNVVARSVLVYNIYTGWFTKVNIVLTFSLVRYPMLFA